MNDGGQRDVVRTKDPEKFEREDDANSDEHRNDIPSNVVREELH